MSHVETGHGFHAGEVAVQQRAGVQAAAERLEGMLGPARLSAGVTRFLTERTFAALTARAADGRLWSVPLLGDPGFLDVVDSTSIRIDAVPQRSGPLHPLVLPQAAGLVVIDYSRRRRFRLNGTLVPPGSDDHLLVQITEAFGNCPQFLPQRTIHPGPVDTSVTTWSGSRADARSDEILTESDRATIRGADTFILGTTHPDRGNDASHRGGPPGFVRTEGLTVWWPDYAGNNLFTSLGNLAVDDEASLLFLDFSRQVVLHLNGSATLTEVPIGSPGDDGGTGRRVVFTIRHVVRSHLTATSRLINVYPENPSITG
jgi:uncharacterized protein